MLGFIIGAILLVFILVGIVAAAVSSLDNKKEVELKSNTILYFDFKNEIADRGSKNPLENFDFASLQSDNKASLTDILLNIEKAKTDDKIKGIYMELAAIPAGIATVQEIRNALLDFKKSGKFIISYGEVLTQKAYYIASVSDKIYLNPQGDLDWKGLGGELMFYKGLLEKVEVDVQVIRHGKFKSAVEPFILDKMSDANRLQTRAFMQSIWNEITDGISKTRNIAVADLNNYANTIALRNPEDAVKYKFVDQLMYKDEVIAELKKRVGKSTKDKLELITVGKYDNAPSKEKKSLSDPKIAVIYATGEIQSGEGNNSKIGSETLAEAIKEAREDDKVKAIVLRVNSPGGSALASEVIWREVYLANKEKPVVVSMGDVAASGGYYIAAAASKIYASPNTITGSIGVFGLILNTQKLLNNKLGITIDTVKTNAMANFGSTSRALTADEKNIMQQGVERVYDTFTSRVAAGRKISQSEVDSVGQGRVWSGKQASEIHLIDEFGGLKEAIAGAAKLAKLNKYRTIELPKQKDPLEEIMKQMTDDVEARYLAYKLGPEAKFVNKLQDILHMQGVQARMPFDVDLY